MNQGQGILPGKLLKWLYQTEYSRSFSKKNVLERSSGVNHDPEISRRTIGHSHKLLEEDSLLNKKDAAVQCYTYKVPVRKSILKKPTQRPETAPARINNNVQGNEKIKENNQKIASDKPITVKEIKNNPTNIDSNVKEIRRYSSLLNIVAGMNSSEYQRAPYIQKKKKVRHKDDSVHLSSNFDQRDFHDSFTTLQNEPDIPKRKISCYDKNHNILRTHTTNESSLASIPPTHVPDHSNIHDDNYFEPDETSKQTLLKYQNYKAYAKYDSHRTSYSDHFKLYQSESPIVSAEKKMILKNKLWNIRHCLSDDNIYNRGDEYYDKEYEKHHYRTKDSRKERRYETEYDCSYRKSFSQVPTKMPENKPNEEFCEYYDQVLENRVIAYHPVLENYARQYAKNKSSSKHKQNNKSKMKTIEDRPAYDPSRYSDDT